MVIEDWKPKWTRKDIQCVGYPLFALFNIVYWMYVIRQCVDIINTIPWQHSILVKPIVAAVLIGEGIFFLIWIAVDGIVALHSEVAQ